MIVTFLALLEMIRLKLIRVFQSGGSGPIRVYKRARPADAPHPIGDPESVTAMLHGSSTGRRQDHAIADPAGTENDWQRTDVADACRPIAVADRPGARPRSRRSSKR